MRSIMAHYVGPTNTKGSRIAVRGSNDAPRRYYPWDYALNSDENFREAARKYVSDRGWVGRMVGTYAPGGGMVFVVGDF